MKCIPNWVKGALVALLALAIAPGLAMASPVALSSASALRAEAVSGPHIDVTPLSHDYGIVNVGASSEFCFTVANLGEMDLNLSNVTSSDPQFAPVAPTSGTIPPGGSMNVCVDYTPTSGASASAVLTFVSDSEHGDFAVSVSGRGNTAPELNPIGDQTAYGFVEHAFDVTAGDDESDPLTFSVTGLPAGATFDTSSGHFDWTPGSGDAGVYPMTFCVTDGFLSTCESITLTVIVANRPPVADPGGPYSGATGQPIVFDGTGSSDPDGNLLDYLWDFGDNGATASSPIASHTYLGAGSYLVTLTVWDHALPRLSNSATTSARVLALIPAWINLKLPPSNTLRVSGGGNQLVGIETLEIPVTLIDPTSVKMSTTYAGAGTVSEISPDPNKAATIGDIDGDHIPDLVVSFSRASINQLLGNVPNNTLITIVVMALSTTGSPIRGTVDVTAKGGGPAAVSASATPNPFNPATTVSVTLKNAGPATVRIYSLEGRLVKTLHDGFAPAGTSQMLWNGLDNSGRRVPTGVYFLNVRSAGENAVQKLYLLK